MSAKRDGNIIQGTAKLKGGKSILPKYDFRLIKLAELPDFPKKRTKK